MRFAPAVLVQTPVVTVKISSFGPVSPCRWSLRAAKSDVPVEEADP
jgi:hypothetical protein